MFELKFIFDFFKFQGALNACKSLKARLDKVKEGLKATGVSDPNWLQVVQKAFASGVDLSEKY